MKQKTQDLIFELKKQGIEYFGTCALCLDEKQIKTVRLIEQDKVFDNNNDIDYPNRMWH
jgi:hypothetical protein